MAGKNIEGKAETPEAETGNEMARPTRSVVNHRTHPPDGSEFDPVHMTGTVSLRQADVPLTDDAALSAAIFNRTDAIRFDRYEEFIRRVLCCDDDANPAVCRPGEEGDYGKSNIEASIRAKRAELIGATGGYGVDAYNLLKYATQAFLLLEAGVVIQEPRFPLNQAEKEIDLSKDRERLTKYLGALNGPLPYLKRVLSALESGFGSNESPFCQGALTHRFRCPSMLELIWSYWHEEGMLVQTMNAICMRFQNRRGPFECDPLANLEIDPLRPLNNFLWGYIQDEYNRLTVPRRAYEYDHHYGLKLVGKAVPELRSADSRSKFIEAFHNLLYRAAAFYREDADTTVVADGFALLNSLQEVHLMLAPTLTNQGPEVTWAARGEMLIIQWLLSRPEMREFLRGNAMVPYSERWMGPVDTMKKLQGWTDTSITHFRNLGIFGEQILLSIRYGDWSEINNQDSAKVWARTFNSQIRGYINAYSAATQVDLSDDIVDFRTAPARYAQPSLLLAERVAGQESQMGLPCVPGDRSITAGGVGFRVRGSRRRALNPYRRG